MHDFRKTRIIMWDIGKNKPNISIHLQIYGSYRTFPIYQSQNVRIFLLMIANSIIWNLLKDIYLLKTKWASNSNVLTPFFNRTIQHKSVYDKKHCTCVKVQYKKILWNQHFMKSTFCNCASSEKKYDYYLNILLHIFFYLSLLSFFKNVFENLVLGKYFFWKENWTSFFFLFWKMFL